MPPRSESSADSARRFLERRRKSKRRRKRKVEPKPRFRQPIEWIREQRAAGFTLTTIGKMLGVTRQRVSQLLDADYYVKARRLDRARRERRYKRMREYVCSHCHQYGHNRRTCELLTVRSASGST